ncbi:MAG TPA: hypothetical protein VF711_01835, partial [Acidimicrobiales bacterium]
MTVRTEEGHQVRDVSVRRPRIGPGLTVLAFAAGVMVLGLAAGGSDPQPALVIVAGLVGIAMVSTAYWTWPKLTVLWFWVFLLFQDSVATAFGKSSSVGHLIAQIENPVLVLLFLLTVVRYGKRRPDARFLVYIPALGFLMSGLLSTVLGHVPPKPALVGALLGCKLFVALIITMLLPWRPQDVERVLNFILKFAVPVAVLTFVDLLFPGPF